MLESKEIYIEYGTPVPTRNTYYETLDRFAFCTPEGGFECRAEALHMETPEVLRVFPVGDGTWAGWIITEVDVFGWTEGHTSPENAMEALQVHHAIAVVRAAFPDSMPTLNALRAYEVPYRGGVEPFGEVPPREKWTRFRSHWLRGD